MPRRNAAPKIDGLWTCRGYYCNSLGGMDLTAPVDPEVWQRAIELMREVDARVDAEHDKSRAVAEARQVERDAAYDRVAQVRGGPLDPNTF
jgi:hypothetical protein